MNAQDIEEFWTLVTSPLSTISDSLQVDIPKAAFNSHQQVNSIQKCLWILRTKFRFISTQKLKLSGLTSVRITLHVLRQLQFPTIISIHSKCAVYNHVVMVWQGQVLDYESEVTYMLTEDLLHQLCGVYFSLKVRKVRPQLLTQNEEAPLKKNLIKLYYKRKDRIPSL
jgi:hypothetical protein